MSNKYGFGYTQDTIDKINELCDSVKPGSSAGDAAKSKPFSTWLSDAIKKSSESVGDAIKKTFDSILMQEDHKRRRRRSLDPKKVVVPDGIICIQPSGSITVVLNSPIPSVEDAGEQEEQKYVYYAGDDMEYGAKLEVVDAMILSGDVVIVKTADGTTQAVNKSKISNYRV